MATPFRLHKTNTALSPPFSWLNRHRCQGLVHGGGRLGITNKSPVCHPKGVLQRRATRLSTILPLILPQLRSASLN